MDKSKKMTPSDYENLPDALYCPYCHCSETVQTILSHGCAEGWPMKVCSQCGLPEDQWDYWNMEMK